MVIINIISPIYTIKKTHLCVFMHHSVVFIEVVALVGTFFKTYLPHNVPIKSLFMVGIFFWSTLNPKCFHCYLDYARHPFWSTPSANVLLKPPFKIHLTIMFIWITFGGHPFWLTHHTHNIIFNTPSKIQTMFFK